MHKKTKSELFGNSGLYIIEIVLPNDCEVSVGKLGLIVFTAGYYYYVGSAQRNLRQRVERHLRNEKTLKWHVDYLTSASTEKQAFLYPGARKECSLMRKLKGISRKARKVKGFGSSDCTCDSHLLHSSVPLEMLGSLEAR